MSITPVKISRSSSGQWIEMDDQTDVFGMFNYAGDPNGNISADIGSFCLDTANGLIYVKKTDSTSSDWELLVSGYETGTFTPVMQGSGGSAGSQTYAYQNGLFTRVGNEVSVYFSVALTNKGSWTGALQLAGLPFTTSASTIPEETRQYCCLRNLTFTSSGIFATAYPLTSNDRFSVQSENGSGGASNQAYSDLTDTTVVLFTGKYQI